MLCYIRPVVTLLAYTNRVKGSDYPNMYIFRAIVISLTPVLILCSLQIKQCVYLIWQGEMKGCDDEAVARLTLMQDGRRRCNQCLLFHYLHPSVLIA